ncbi:unnamed protein product [Nesidiocoris tenuis]|uniref:C2H2-type domain-containing protein n=1 Tax=Nesidiocoris tenuis TaxID=355587 RepID=A0A6H5HTP4_9HEMI|nr:unnamed protein product [Nesidiocoris tenuis]
MAEKVEDLNLPLSVITRIVKDSLPNGTNVSKEARTALARAASVFILYITSTANDIATKSSRKTINTNDVLKALEETEFDEFMEPLSASITGPGFVQVQAEQQRQMLVHTVENHLLDQLDVEDRLAFEQFLVLYHPVIFLFVLQPVPFHLFQPRQQLVLPVVLLAQHGDQQRGQLYPFFRPDRSGAEYIFVQPQTKLTCCKKRQDGGRPLEDDIVRRMRVPSHVQGEMGQPGAEAESVWQTAERRVTLQVEFFEILHGPDIGRQFFEPVERSAQDSEPLEVCDRFGEGLDQIVCLVVFLSRHSSNSGSYYSGTVPSESAIPKKDNNFKKKKKKYECHYCSFTTKYRVSISSHIKMLHLKHFPCKDCKFETKVWKFYLEHVNVKHRLAILRKLLAPANIGVFERCGSGVARKKPPFACLKCDVVLDSFHKVSNHNWNKHLASRRRVCKHCGFRTASASQLRNHLKSHTGEKPFQCSHCDFRSARADTVKTHEMRHTGEKPYACKLCSYRSNQKGHLAVHSLVHTDIRPFKCPDCDYRAREIGKLKIHRTLHTGEKRFECQQCEYRTSHRSSLNTHVLRHSDKEALKKFKCEQCDFRAPTKDKVAIHNLIHTGERPMKCDICDFRCNQMSNLRSHMTKHTENRPFSCDVCNMKFKSMAHLGSHKRTVHVLKPQFQCDQCEYKAKTKCGLKHHALIHSEERAHECPVCQRGFKQKGEMKRHLRLHSDFKPVACQRCDMKFRTNSSLRCHMMTHTGEKPHACTECSFRCTQRGTLVNHINAVHMKLNRFECVLCEYVAKTPDTLAEHISDHTGVKPFDCSLCTMKFATKRGVRSHVRSNHTNLPEQFHFQCDVCLSSFRLPTQLAAHKEKCRETELPFLCGDCQKRFKTERSLRIHLSKCRNKIRLVCRFCKKMFKLQNTYERHLKCHGDKFVCGVCDHEADSQTSLRSHFASVHSSKKRKNEVDASEGGKVEPSAIVQLEYGSAEDELTTENSDSDVERSDSNLKRPDSNLERSNSNLRRSNPNLKQSNSHRTVHNPKRNIKKQSDHKLQRSASNPKRLASNPKQSDSEDDVEFVTISDGIKMRRVPNLNIFDRIPRIVIKREPICDLDKPALAERKSCKQDSENSDRNFRGTKKIKIEPPTDEPCDRAPLTEHSNSNHNRIESEDFKFVSISEAIKLRRARGSNISSRIPRISIKPDPEVKSEPE